MSKRVAIGFAITSFAAIFALSSVAFASGRCGSNTGRNTNTSNTRTTTTGTTTQPSGSSDASVGTPR
jgi:hypothetical protein